MQGMVDLMKHKKPDRSNYKPNFSKTAENDVLDVGWNEGFLSDGRPYRAEMWCQDQVTSLTFFVPTSGIETMSNQQFCDMLVREGLVTFKSEERYVSAAPFTDASGNSVWSVNAVMGDDESIFAVPKLPIRPYGKDDASKNEATSTVPEKHPLKVSAKTKVKRRRK